MKRFTTALAALTIALLATASQGSEINNGSTSGINPGDAIIMQQTFDGTKNVVSGGFQPNHWVILFIPEFHYGEHGSMKSKLTGDTKLKTSGGHSTTMNFSFAAARPINETVSLSGMFQYAHTEYSGGLFTADMNGHDGSTSMYINTFLFGLTADFDFKEYGRVGLALAQAWDMYTGNEVYEVYGHGEKRKIDDFKSRGTSIMAWYDVDVPLAEKWTLVPYAGWRSLYADVRNTNMFAYAAGTDAALDDSNNWIHLISGGGKIQYKDGLFGAYARAGINHRLTSDDIPGYASRATAPGVIHQGVMIQMDRTVGAWGAGINYVIPGSCILDLSYNGFAGVDANFHTATLALILPF